MGTKTNRRRNRTMIFGVFGLTMLALLAAWPVGVAEAGQPGTVTWHGYGELHYNDPKGSSVPGKDDPAQMDFHRMVWGMSYSWDERISLHAEVDFEHAAKEIELEFAYLDFLIRPEFNLRAGVVLMPVGPLNEFHEPPRFFSVERPYLQRTVIPTTWQEGGVGLFGTLGEDFNYRAYLVSGLDSKGFTAKDGIRKGRTNGGDAPNEKFAWVGRLEYIGVPGLSLGTSVYHGGANQDPTSDVDIDVTLLEGDIKYTRSGLDFQAMYAQIDIDNPDKIVGQTVGEKIAGWNVELAYHLSALDPDTQQDLVPFVRWESFNTQEATPAAAYAADPANDRKVFTVGLAYYPIPDVVVKADLETWEDADNNDTGEEKRRFNLGLGYQF